MCRQHGDGLSGQADGVGGTGAETPQHLQHGAAGQAPTHGSGAPTPALLTANQLHGVGVR